MPAPALSLVSAVLGPGGSRQPLFRGRTPLRSVSEDPGPPPQNSSYFWGRGSRTFTLQVKKNWNLETENWKEVTRSLVLLAGFSQSRRCLGFLKLCLNFQQWEWRNKQASLRIVKERSC